MGPAHGKLHIRAAPMVVLAPVMLSLVILGAVLPWHTDAERQLAMVLIFAGVGAGLSGVVILPLFITRRCWTLLA